MCPSLLRRLFFHANLSFALTLKGWTRPQSALVTISAWAQGLTAAWTGWIYFFNMIWSTTLVHLSAEKAGVFVCAVGLYTTPAPWPLLIPPECIYTYLYLYMTLSPAPPVHLFYQALVCLPPYPSGCRSATLKFLCTMTVANAFQDGLLSRTLRLILRGEEQK